MPIAPQLQRFIVDELARSSTLIEQTLDDTLQLLRGSKEGGLAAGERSQQFDLVDGLQRHAVTYKKTFVDALQSRVRAELERQDGGKGMDPPSGLGGLALMDESRVEIDIEVSRATQAIDAAAEWELRELQTFTSTLIGQAHVSAESNPLRPALYATALWDAACVIHPQQAQRATLLRVSAHACAGRLKTAWAAASTRLESQGVVPGIYRTVLLAPGAVQPRHVAAEGAKMEAALKKSPAAPLRGLLDAMPGGPDPSAIALDERSSPGRAGPSTTPDFEGALASLAELLRHWPENSSSASDGEALAKRLDAQRATLAASAPTTRERQLTALLSRAFDAILADRKLHLPFAALVFRLQASALRVALADPSTVESTRHPVWELLDRLGLASATYPQPGDPRGAALLTFCTRLAAELTRHARPDADLYRKALARLDEFLAAQVRAQLKMADAAVETLRQAERLETLERSLSQRLVEQMAPLRPSAAVRRFMSGPWSRVLAVAMLRFGEDAEPTRQYIKLVDELLWSVQLPDHPASRQRLIALLPGLLQRLRAGMALVPLAEPEQQAILTELMAIHTEALRPGGRAASTELTPEQIVQKMREEVIPAPVQSTGHGDGVIDLASMETVPAELMPAASAARTGDATHRQLHSLEPPERRRMFVNGRWARVQLLWRSEQGEFFLFAGEIAGQTHSITRRALERLVAEGLLRPLETKPLSQRALDSVTRSLAPAAAPRA